MVADAIADVVTLGIPANWVDDIPLSDPTTGRSDCALEAKLSSRVARR